MTEGKILYARKGRQCFVKMVGEIRHPLSPGFDAVLQEIFDEGTTDAFIIDMNETIYLDSTNLGLLGKIARHELQEHGDKPIIISHNEGVNTLLRSMGFDRVFTIITQYLQSEADLQETPDIEATDRQRAEVILEAHKSLMEMNDKNRQMYHHVVEMFEKSIPPNE